MSLDRQPSSPSEAPRQDLLVSICFGDLEANAESFDAVEKMAWNIDGRFRFREIILVVGDSFRDDFLPLVRRINNLRLFTVPDKTAFYRRRVIAADEAIGDVVMMASISELGYVDPVALIERAADEQSSVLATRPTGIVDRTLVSPLTALGRMSGFQMDLRHLKSLAVPRTLLNQLLAHPDAELALRFPPRDERVPLVFTEVSSDVPVARESGQLRRRLVLTQRLMVYMAPRLLMGVTLSAVLLAALGFFYALYVVGVWIIVDNVASGWLTLSAMLSVTALFLGVSIMGLSLGLQELLARTNRINFDSVSSEVNRIDLFDQVASELNVDLDNDRGDISGSSRR